MSDLLVLRMMKARCSVLSVHLSAWREQPPPTSMGASRCDLLYWYCGSENRASPNPQRISWRRTKFSVYSTHEARAYPRFSPQPSSRLDESRLPQLPALSQSVSFVAVPTRSPHHRLNGRLRSPQLLSTRSLGLLTGYSISLVRSVSPSTQGDPWCPALVLAALYYRAGL